MNAPVRRTVKHRRKLRGKSLGIGRARVALERGRIHPRFEDREVTRPSDSLQRSKFPTDS